MGKSNNNAGASTVGTSATTNPTSPNPQQASDSAAAQSSGATPPQPNNPTTQQPGNPPLPPRPSHTEEADPGDSYRFKAELDGEEKPIYTNNPRYAQSLADRGATVREINKPKFRNT